MHKVAALCLASGFLFSAGTAFADADLVRKSNCMACHAVDQKRFGPSWKQVSAKYDGDSGAAVMLSNKIQNGGMGVWGQAPMPAQAQVSDADAKILAEYILSIK
jgi:cytochrome c